jgi:hypothetical protein
MIHERFHDPIHVQVLFAGTKIKPVNFWWGKNPYHIQRVLNAYSTFSGRERIHYFSVATETDFFKLELNTERLQWFLVEHFQGEA